MEVVLEEEKVGVMEYYRGVGDLEEVVMEE